MCSTEALVIFQISCSDFTKIKCFSWKRGCSNNLMVRIIRVTTVTKLFAIIQETNTMDHNVIQIMGGVGLSVYIVQVG